MAPGPINGTGDRRALLRLAMAAALAPVFASRGLAAAAAAAAPFAPPQAPMRFTRRLERGLPDGNRMIVSRGFAVRFAPVAGGGWSVTGEQADVAVDFPERIAALAALERQRKETGLFPLRLDAAGRIVGGAAPQPSRELDEAVAIVKRELDKHDFSPGDRAQLDAFVRAVHDAGAHMATALPGDLFAPADDATRAERALALPGGEQGTILVTFTAVTDPVTGLMRQAQRDIVTTIADDSRRTREDWTLGLL